MRDALRSAPLFEDLPDDDLDRLLENAVEDSYPSGATVFEEGDPGDRACLILEGRVEILKSSVGGDIRLAVREVGTQIHYPTPPHLSRAYAAAGWQRGAFPLAEQFANEVLSLPIGPHVTGDLVDFVASRVREFFRA